MRSMLVSFFNIPNGQGQPHSSETKPVSPNYHYVLDHLLKQNLISEARKIDTSQHLRTKR